MERRRIEMGEIFLAKTNYDHFDQYIKQHPEKGYTSVEDFVNKTLAQRRKDLKEEETRKTVKVEVHLVKAQYEWLCRLLEKNPWMGNLETFIISSIRECQEKLWNSCWAPGQPGINGLPTERRVLNPLSKESSRPQAE